MKNFFIIFFVITAVGMISMCAPNVSDPARINPLDPNANLESGTQFEVFFYAMDSGWASANIYYRFYDDIWTGSNGVAITNMDSEGWYVTTVSVNNPTLECAFNDGMEPEPSWYYKHNEHGSYFSITNSPAWVYEYVVHYEKPEVNTP